MKTSHYGDSALTSQTFPPNRTVDERHYLDLVNQELSQRTQQTQAHQELAHLLETIPYPDDCQVLCRYSDRNILGCLGNMAKMYPVWLEQWLLLRQQGIPNSLRAHKDLIVWLCANCRLLERSKRHGRLTAWVRETAKTIHKAPKWVRGVYEHGFDSLQISLIAYRKQAQETKAKMLKYIAHDTIEVGQSYPMMVGVRGGRILVNIDTTLLRLEGKITMAWWSPNQEFPLL